MGFGVSRSLAAAIRRFSMSSELGKETGQRYTGITDPKPVKCIVFMEEDDNLNNPGNGINDGNIGLRRYPALEWGDSPARRHDNGATVSMADGHAEYYKWKSPNKPFVRGNISSGRGPVTVTSEIQDFHRLQEGMPGWPQ
jgi:prepilin-type processing-associated H-X9-DG protein